MMTVKSKIISFLYLCLVRTGLQFVKSFTNKRAPVQIEQYGGSLCGLIQKFKYKTTDFYVTAPILLSKFGDLLVKIEKGRVERTHTEEFKFLEFNQKKIVCLLPGRKIRGKENILHQSRCRVRSSRCATPRDRSRISSCRFKASLIYPSVIFLFHRAVVVFQINILAAQE